MSMKKKSRTPSKNFFLERTPQIFDDGRRMAGWFYGVYTFWKKSFFMVLYSLGMEESIYEKKLTDAITRLESTTVAATF